MDEFAKISPGERNLLEIVKSLKPFERVEIIADKDGKADTFFVHRQSKVIINGFAIVAVK